LNGFGYCKTTTQILHHDEGLYFFFFKHYNIGQRIRNKKTHFAVIANIFCARGNREKQKDEDQKIGGNLLGLKPSATCRNQDLAKKRAIISGKRLLRSAIFTPLSLRKKSSGRTFLTEGK